MIASLLLVACAAQPACASSQAAHPPAVSPPAVSPPAVSPPAERPGVATLRDAEKVLGLGNPEQSRVLVDRAITEMFAAHPEANDEEDDHALRDAGALAYKLRSMESARRAWDAVRKYREKTLDPDSREVQNARGNVSWIGEQMGLVAEARVLEEQILAALEKTAAPNDEALLFARSNLADTLLQQDVEHERALDLMRHVAEARRAQFAAGHKKRLRAELDLACGLVGVGQLEDADAVVARVLAECPADATELRVRAASDLVWIRAARGERDPFAAGLTTLAVEIERAQADIRKRTWREAEVRTAELAPFVDVLLSAALGLDVFPAEDGWMALAAGRFTEDVSMNPPPVAFHRFERSRLAGDGRARRVIADERLGAVIPAGADGSGARWIDLGPMSVARASVRALDAALREGSGGAQAESVARSIFAPVVHAVGDPERFAFVPADVLWAVPTDVVALRHDADRVTRLMPVLFTKSRHIPLALGGEVVLGDPSPIDESARTRAAASPVSSGGAACAYIPAEVPAMRPSIDAYARLFGVEPLRDADANVARFRALMSEFGRICLTLPVWSAPDDAPCLTTPRSIAISTPLAAAMAREDVVGGSSPADLCGLAFSDFSADAGANQRVAAAPRAADLRELSTSFGLSLLVTASPPRSDVVLRARDLEALARAFIAAGSVSVCLATQPLRVGQEGSLIETLSPLEADSRGPWLRLSTVH